MINLEYLIFSNINILTFSPSKQEDGLYVQRHDSGFHCETSTMDPLSLYLISNQPDRMVINNDDNEMIRVLSFHLNQKPSWLRGFLCGWYDINNSSSSIGGYMYGRALMLKVKKELANGK